MALDVLGNCGRREDWATTFEANDGPQFFVDNEAKGRKSKSFGF